MGIFQQSYNTLCTALMQRYFLAQLLYEQQYLQLFIQTSFSTQLPSQHEQKLRSEVELQMKRGSSISETVAV